MKISALLSTVKPMARLVELSREVRHVLESELEGDAIDRAMLFQQVGGKGQALCVEPILWTASKYLPGVASQLALANLELLAQGLDAIA